MFGPPVQPRLTFSATWVDNQGMQKTKAIELLGGTVAEAARVIGVSYQAVEKWPDTLPPRIADRVVAAIARKKLTPCELGLEPCKGNHKQAA